MVYVKSVQQLPINICILDLFRVGFLRENTLLRVSHLFFLNHFRVCDFVHFYFGFGVILKNPSTRGPHSTLEVSLEYFSSFGMDQDVIDLSVVRVVLWYGPRSDQ